MPVLIPALLCLYAAAQQLPPALTTDPPADKAHPAAMQTMLIPSHGQNLNALMYTAAGAGPHPVVLLLHGLPGNEKNLDLAQSMRRTGWNVLFINYRGSWGTPGDFSFSNSTEDVAAALAWLRDPANAQKTASNPKRIVLIGHSMGGFMAAFGTAHDPAVEAVAMISAADLGSEATGPEGPVVAGLAAAYAAEGLEPLKTTAELLARDTFTHRTDWTFAAFARTIGNRPVLLITSDDGLATHSAALGQALRKAGNTKLTEQHFTTDHAYSGKRIALQTKVLQWLATLN